MKEKFKSFYQLSEEELKVVWSDKDTIFIFDTNILLNLYQYSQETRDEFFKVLEAIESRIWIPFHVALEYQRRRLEIIKDEKSVFIKINKKLEDITGIVEKDFADLNLKDRNPVLFDMKEKFKKDIRDLVESFQDDVKTQDDAQPSVRSEDKIRAKLDDLFTDKVGEEPNEELLKKIYEEGEDRYKKNVPPGYKDTNKEKNPEEAIFSFNAIEYQRKFGDLIIWKQIVSYAKDCDALKNVVFVTDDSKEDWWELIDSRGKKVIGARPELKSEIYKEAEIENFKMYHSNDFLTDAEKYYNISIDENAIDEAKEHLDYSTHSVLDIMNEYKSSLSALDEYKSGLSALDTYRTSLSTLDKYKFGLGALDEYRSSLSALDEYKSGLSALDEYRSSLSALDEYKSGLSFLDTRSTMQKFLDNLEINRNNIDSKRNDEDD